VAGGGGGNHVKGCRPVVGGGGGGGAETSVGWVPGGGGGGGLWGARPWAVLGWQRESEELVSVVWWGLCVCVNLGGGGRGWV